MLEQAGFVNMYVEDHSDKLISLGLKLLFSDLSKDASTLSVKDQEVLEKLFDEDLLNYALIAAYKPTLQKEEQQSRRGG